MEQGKLDFEHRKLDFEHRKPEFQTRKPEFQTLKPDFEYGKPEFETWKLDFEVREVDLGAVERPLVGVVTFHFHKIVARHVRFGIWDLGFGILNEMENFRNGEMIRG